MANSSHIFMPENHMEGLYNSPNPIVSYIHNNRLETIIREVKGKNLRILDAGCGEGHLISRLFRKYPKNSYYGIDITNEALSSARKRCRYARILKMSLDRLKFKDGFFDVIICTEVLEHIYEYKQVLKEFSRVLKKGGKLLLTFPNETLWTLGRFLLGRRPVKVPDHVNAFSPGIIKRSLKLSLVKQKNMPLNLPFFMSLGGFQCYRK